MEGTIYQNIIVGLVLFLGGIVFYLLRRLRVLEVKAREADRLLTLRGRLTREIAHEIKNPISAILCSVETLNLILRDKLEGTEKEMLHGIKDYGDTLLRLVTDFLEVSMTESGVTKVDPTPLALSTVVPGVCSLLKSVAARKSIDLDIKGDGSCMIVHADERHLKQILFNLIQNAIKFTPAGGTITVQMMSDPDLQLMTIGIHDTGIGIPPDKVEKLFELYERLEDEHDDVGGYGVGLYLCKLLVELSGGAITVESVEGVGSSFFVTFPGYVVAVEDQELSEGERIEASAHTFHGERLLVLDDIDGQLQTVEPLLHACGAVVDTVNDAIDAIEMLGKHDYDVLFVNGEFDGGVGYEIPSLIRKDLANPGLDIVVAARNNALSERALERGANRTVLKPFSVPSMLESIARSMRLRKKEPLPRVLELDTDTLDEESMHQ